MIERNAMPDKIENILKRLKKELRRIYGDDLDRIILYGSRARGTARDDSDIDILIVLKRNFDYSEALRRSSKVTASLSLENDVVISRAFVTKIHYETLQVPFLMNVRREGVAV